MNTHVNLNSKYNQMIDLVTADCEANGLLDTVTKVHCVVAKDHATGEVYKFWGEQLITEFPEFAKRVKKWVIHNGLGYDIPLWKMMLGVDISHKDVIDSLILSRMEDADRRAPFNCDDPKARKAPHGLGCWGYRVGLGKPDIDDWDIDMNDPVARAEMFNRCETDVEINERVYDVLKRDMDKKGFSAFSIRLEHDFREVMNRMTTHGFFLDVPKALKLQRKLDTRVANIRHEVQEHFRPQPKFEKVYELRVGKGTTNVSVVGLKDRFPEADMIVLAKEDIKAYRKGFREMSVEDKRVINAGTIPLKEEVAKVQEKLDNLIVGDFSFFDWKEFDLSSPKQVVERLNEIGWNPVNRTDAYKKNQQRLKDNEITKQVFDERAKLAWKSTDEDNLNTIPANAPQSAKLIAEYAWTSNRSGTITQWMDAVSSDDYLRGRITTIGAWSQRCSHQAPNMANLPSVSMMDVERTEHGFWKFKKDKETGEKKYIGVPTLLTDFFEIGYSDTMYEKVEGKAIGEEFEIPVLGKEGRYGYEMRGCLTVEDSFKRCIAGADASGIQLRALCHYMGDEDYKEAILTGDIHKFNASKLFTCKVEDVTPDQRRVSKTFIYAFLLGAGDWKIGDIAGIPEGGFLKFTRRIDGKYEIVNERTGVVKVLSTEKIFDMGLGKYIEKTDWRSGAHKGWKQTAKVSEKIAKGAMLRKKFLDGLPKLAELIEEAHRRANKGYMMGVDGRAVPVPSKHKSLTAYLQSFEAIIMKTAIVLWYKKVEDKGLDAHGVAFVHDELQMDCAKKDGESAGSLFVDCLGKAGKLYETFIPIDGEYLVGNHWADCH